MSSPSAGAMRPRIRIRSPSSTARPVVSSASTPSFPSASIASSRPIGTCKSSNLIALPSGVFGRRRSKTGTSERLADGPSSPSNSTTDSSVYGSARSARPIVSPARLSGTGSQFSAIVHPACASRWRLGEPLATRGELADGGVASDEHHAGKRDHDAHGDRQQLSGERLVALLQEQRLEHHRQERLH